MAGQRPGLRRRIIEAAGLMLGAHGIELVLRLVSNLIMTRLLFPEAFGLVAVAMSILVGLTLLTDAGIKASIVRSPSGEDRDYLKTAWTLQIIRGLVIWLIVLILAGLLSTSGHRWLPEQSTLAHPLMPGLLAVVGAMTVLQGLQSVNLHVSVRRIDFRRLILVGIISKLVSLPVMLLWALHDRSVWALVAGMMAASLVQLALSHSIFPGPRMGLRWHPGHVREMFNFGKWVTVSSVAHFVSSHSEQLILGALFPGSIIGLYAIAKLLADAFQGILLRLQGALTLPVLSEVLRDSPETLRDKYYRLRLPIEAGAFLSAGVLLAAGPGIVEVLYDDRYREVGWMLQIVALSLLITPLQAIGHAFVANGQTRFVAAVSIFQAASLVVALSVGYLAGGLGGAIFGIAVSKFPATLVFLVFGYRSGWISPWREVRMTPLIAVGAVIGQGGMWIVDSAGWMS